MQPFEQFVKNLQSKSTEIKDKMSEIQRKLSTLEIEGSAGGDMVKIVLNGRYEAKRTIIDPSLLNQPIQVLCDLVTSAVTDAVHKVESVTQSEMLKLLQR